MGQGTIATIGEWCTAFVTGELAPPHSTLIDEELVVVNLGAIGILTLAAANAAGPYIGKTRKRVILHNQLHYSEWGGFQKNIFKMFPEIIILS